MVIVSSNNSKYIRTVQLTLLHTQVHVHTGRDMVLPATKLSIRTYVYACVYIDKAVHECYTATNHAHACAEYYIELRI